MYWSADQYLRSLAQIDQLGQVNNSNQDCTWVCSLRSSWVGEEAMVRLAGTEISWSISARTVPECAPSEVVEWGRKQWYVEQEPRSADLSLLGLYLSVRPSKQLSGGGNNGMSSRNRDQLIYLCQDCTWVCALQSSWVGEEAMVCPAGTEIRSSSCKTQFCRRF